MSSSPTPSDAVASTALPGSLYRRVFQYAAWFAATCLLFFVPLSRFVRYALTNDNASHAILVPAICVWILYLERKHIFADLDADIRLASLFFVPGCLAAAGCFLAHLKEVNQLSVCMLALILFWIAGFAFRFGRTALSRARFPLAFLLLTIPIPDFLLDRTIYFLQKGTT